MAAAKLFITLACITLCRGAEEAASESGASAQTVQESLGQLHATLASLLDSAEPWEKRAEGVKQQVAAVAAQIQSLANDSGDKVATAFQEQQTRFADAIRRAHPEIEQRISAIQALLKEQVQKGFAQRDKLWSLYQEQHQAAQALAAETIDNFTKTLQHEVTKLWAPADKPTGQQAGNASADNASADNTSADNASASPSTAGSVA